ncbi:MAG TPA: AbrB/MazE/SpoVT family DNA-binding domain-containing protein [Candidatus Angelobacter sp.]|jgi:putative addiction module antidote|nr:AbrB/MazE/SpoVT family DNA-binding domain-containing protein [Candidatus Angelobacter sp.]
MAVLKLTSLGTSTGVVIPKDMLERLQVGEGDELFAMETPQGYLITAHNPEVERQLKVAQRVMGEYEETLRLLAK